MKALWIRVDAHKVDSPEVCELADALDIDVVLALGYVVTLGGAVAEHTDDGNIADVPDTTIERWARWKGKRGAFAPALRHGLQNAEGEYDNWHEAMGQLVERRAKDRARKDGKPRGNSTEVPRKPRGSSTESARDSAATERDVTERNGSASSSHQESSTRRSGDLDQERASAPPRSFASFAELPPDVIAFGARFYRRATARRRRDVAEQLLALANGDGVEYKGQRILAGSVDRLVTACRAIRRVDADNAAIAYLLVKLGDTTDVTAEQVEHDRTTRQREELDTAAELAHADAWLADDPARDADINAQLDALGFSADPGDVFAQVTRNVARTGVLLAAWRAAQHPELAHAS